MITYIIRHNYVQWTSWRPWCKWDLWFWWFSQDDSYNFSVPTFICKLPNSRLIGQEISKNAFWHHIHKRVKALANARIFTGISEEKKKKDRASRFERGISLGLSGIFSGYPSLRQASAVFLPSFHVYSLISLGIKSIPHKEMCQNYYLKGMVANFLRFAEIFPHYTAENFWLWFFCPERKKLLAPSSVHVLT